MPLPWIIGGLIVGGIVAAASYDDHSDYSDSAERTKKARLECEGLIQKIEYEAQNEKRKVQQQQTEVRNYKSSSVNPQLENSRLIAADAMTVSATSLDEDAREKINKNENRELTANRELREIQNQIHDIDALLAQIDNIDNGENDDDEDWLY